jgi:hypothetical protein
MKYWNVHGCVTLAVWATILAVAAWWAGGELGLW